MLEKKFTVWPFSRVSHPKYVEFVTVLASMGQTLNCIAVLTAFLFVDSHRALSEPSASNAVSQSLDVSGLHNVYRLNEQIFTGSSPDGETGFRSLRRLGVRTIISVDGARPDVETARKYGLKYVHLPLGYDGIPQTRVMQLSKAVRDLPGPCYLHCHHGKHRGPAAAAAVHLCLDKSCTIETAIREMKQSGTDVSYRGLYAVPSQLVRPTSKELDDFPVNFPEVAEVSNLTQMMVEIDSRFDRLKQSQSVGWQRLKQDSEVDPAHEALLLLEHYREAKRLPEVVKRNEEFRRLLDQAEENAAALEKALKGSETPATTERNDLFRHAKEFCSKCHNRFRDVPTN